MFNLKNSLTRRLILFLFTASPTFLLTAIPSLLFSPRFLNTMTVKFSECRLTPRLYMIRNSPLFLILSSLRKFSFSINYGSLWSVLDNPVLGMTNLRCPHAVPLFGFHKNKNKIRQITSSVP